MNKWLLKVFVFLWLVVANMSNASLTPIISRLAAEMAKHTASAAAAHEILEIIHRDFSSEQNQDSIESQRYESLEQQIGKLGSTVEIQSLLSALTFHNQVELRNSLERQQAFSGLILKIQEDLSTKSIELQTQHNATTQKALKQLHNVFDTRVKHMMQQITQTAAHQAKLIEMAQKEIDKKARLDIIESKRKNDRAQIQMGIDGFSCMSSIAAICGDRHLARQIIESGSGVLKIWESASAISAFKAQVAVGALAASDASALIAGGWVGIAAGAASLIASLFGDSGEDNASKCTEVILESIGQLSHQMHQYHVQTMQSLQGINQHLKDQDTMMLRNFFDLKLGQDNLQFGQEVIKRQLRKIYEQNGDTQAHTAAIGSLIEQNQSVLMKSIAGMCTKDVNNLLDEVEFTTEQSKISSTKFQKLLVSLVIEGARRAKEKHVTGGAVNIDNPGEVIQALQAGNCQGNPW